MIEVKNVFFEYDNFRALKGVSCQVSEASIIGLVGPNGAGKTTLMRCMATYQHPFSGSIYIDGLSTSDQTRDCHRLVKFLPDFSCFYESLTVKDFLLYIAGSHNQLTPTNSKVVETVELLGLQDYVMTPLKSLSRGWRQRTGIASMVVTGAKYLLLDEPASGLDPEARMHLAEVFKELKKRGHGILVSSHILEELGQYCDDIIVMQNGKIRTKINRAEEQRSTVFEVETTKPQELKELLESQKDALAIKRIEKRNRNIRDVYLENMEDRN